MVGNITFRPMTPDEIAARDRAVQVEQDKLRYQHIQAGAAQIGGAAVPEAQKPRQPPKAKSGTQWPPKVKTPASKPRKGK